MKYIDAERLKAEIERLYYNEAEKDESILAADAYKNALDAVEKFIDSLQQEQPEVDYETELKKCKDNPLYFYDKYVSIKQKPADWKPTEEQLKALQMVRDSHCFMYQQERIAIETLLNQLKSL